MDSSENLNDKKDEEVLFWDDVIFEDGNIDKGDYEFEDKDEYAVEENVCNEIVYDIEQIEEQESFLNEVIEGSDTYTDDLYENEPDSMKKKISIQDDSVDATVLEQEVILDERMCIMLKQRILDIGFDNLTIHDFVKHTFCDLDLTLEFYNKYAKSQDGDLAMKNAIATMFPKAHHKLCAWHLLRNSTNNIANPLFTSQFKKLILDDYEVFVQLLSARTSIRLSRRNTRLTLSPSKECLLYRHLNHWRSLQHRFFHLRCSCMRMESLGIPCDHIVRVLVHRHIPKLPESLVLRRWRKDAKEGMEVSARGIENDARFVVAHDWAIEILKAGDAEDAGHDATTITNTTSNIHGSTSCAPGDPPVCKTKGQSGHKCSRGLKHCTIYKGLKHNKTTCPKRKELQK
ncbi:hypothetical protein AHAS_Ahas18G0138600 [Arachis hypogaea]